METAIDPRLAQRVTETEERFRAVERQLADPDVVRSPDRLRELGRERAALAGAARAGREVRAVEAELGDARDLLAESDVRR